MQLMVVEVGVPRRSGLFENLEKFGAPSTGNDRVDRVFTVLSATLKHAGYQQADAVLRGWA